MLPMLVESLGKGLLEELALYMGFGGSVGVSQESERGLGGVGYSRQRNSRCKGLEEWERGPSGELLLVCVGRGLRGGLAGLG